MYCGAVPRAVSMSHHCLRRDIALRSVSRQMKQGGSRLLQSLFNLDRSEEICDGKRPWRGGGACEGSVVHSLWPAQTLAVGTMVPCCSTDACFSPRTTSASTPRSSAPTSNM